MKPLTNKQFIDRFNKSYLSKHCELISDYVTMKDIMFVKCFKYGQLHCISARNILKKTSGLNISTAYDKDKYLKIILNDKNPNLLKEADIIGDYSGNITDKILLKCKKYEELYEIRLPDLLNGYNITISGCLNPTRLIQKKINEVHPEKYQYQPFTYKRGRQKLKIKCHIHGWFEQSILHHVTRKQGCPECAKELTIYGNWDNDLLDKRSGKLYIIKCYNDEELFYKIGVTKRENINERFNQIHYETELLYVFEHEDKSKVIQMEQDLLNKLLNYRYIPYNKFGGHTECINEEGFDILEKILISLDIKKVS